MCTASHVQQNIQWLWDKCGTFLITLLALSYPLGLNNMTPSNAEKGRDKEVIVSLWETF